MGTDARQREITEAIRKWGSGNAAARKLAGKYTRYEVQRVARSLSQSTSVDGDIAAKRDKREKTDLQKKYDDALKLIESQRAKIESFESYRKPEWNDVPRAKAKPSGDAAAILCWADWHLDARVDPETVDGVNEYNLDVFHRRFHAMLQNSVTMIEAARMNSVIDEVVVALLGDSFSNFLRPENMVSNTLGPAEAKFEATCRIKEGIEFVRKHAGAKRVRVVACYGNHTRMTDKIWSDAAESVNHEYETYLCLAKEYAEGKNPVPWEICKGPYITVDIKGKRVRFHHGDAIKFNGGVGGITIPVNKTVSQWNKIGVPADLDVFGHFHQFKYDKGSRWVSCPTMQGYCRFAAKIKADFEEPAQCLIVLDRRHKAPVLVRDVFCK